MNSWDKIRKAHHIRKTPKSLATSLKYGSKSGYYHSHNFWIPYNVVYEDNSMWVVNSELISRNGISSGGVFYVSKKNPNKCVFE